jgi:hypothetical protein
VRVPEQQSRGRYICDRSHAHHDKVESGGKENRTEERKTEIRPKEAAEGNGMEKKRT